MRVDIKPSWVHNESSEVENGPAEQKQKEAMVINTYAPTYRFRPGAIDAIARSRNFTTDDQLALYIGVKPEHLPLLRAGAEVSARIAYRVSALQGDEAYIGAWFDPVETAQAA